MNRRSLLVVSSLAVLWSLTEPSSRRLVRPNGAAALSQTDYVNGCHVRCHVKLMDNPVANAIGYPVRIPRSRRSLFMAISSSELKNNDKDLISTSTYVSNKKKKQQYNNHTNEVSGEGGNEKTKRKVKGISNNVVSRLARAAKEAAAAKKKKEEMENTETNDSNEGKRAKRNIYYEGDDEDLYSDDHDDDHGDDVFKNEEGSINDIDMWCENLSSITNLNKVIDEELLRHPDGYKPSRETDSIRVLLEHNNNVDLNDRASLQKSIISSSSSSRLRKKGHKLVHNEVAIVFGRPLSEGQLTIEYAVRLVSLAKAMKFEGYRPNLICFCTPASSAATSSNTNAAAEAAPKHKSVASIGVDFFKQLCSANEISLENTSLCPIPTSLSTATSRSNTHKHDIGGSDDTYRSAFSNQYGSSSSISSSWSPSSLSPIVKKLLDNKYIEKWLEESRTYESDMDEYGMTRQEPRKKIHIHWKLFSTEYDLCNLNDIHIRSPRQSPLARLVYDLEHAANSEHYRRGIIQTTWSFHYSIYPYVVSSSKEKMKEAFLGKCYLMAQSLVPLLVNLKGVAENVSSPCWIVFMNRRTPIQFFETNRQSYSFKCSQYSRSSFNEITTVPWLLFADPLQHSSNK